MTTEWKLAEEAFEKARKAWFDALAAREVEAARSYAEADKAYDEACEAYIAAIKDKS